MNRIEAALDAWVAPDTEQELLRQEFLHHAHTVNPPDLRKGRPDHVTASALVVSDDNRAVLLGLHRKVGQWLQFGGHVEADDATLEAAALREAREETGLVDVELRSADPVRLDRHSAPCSPSARHHLDVQFVAAIAGCPDPHVSDESLDVRWFAVEKLPQLTDAAVRRLVVASCR